MGREIIVGLKKRSKDNKIETIYEDFVCGRDDATTLIANWVDNKVNDYSGDIDSLSDDEINELYSLIYTCKEDIIPLIERLDEYKKEDYKEIKKAKDDLRALDEARRHCGVYEEFTKFTSAMESVQEWLDNEDYSRAGSLIEIINKCLIKSEDLSDNYEIWVTLSE